MNVHMTKEEQFATALMLLGELPNIRYNLNPTLTQALTNAQKPVSYPEFRLYRTKLCALLDRAGMFDVYYERRVHGVGGTQLTEMAAKWIAEYFRWMARQQAGVTQHV